MNNDIFLVSNKVRIWRTGRHTPTKNSHEYPPGLRASLLGGGGPQVGEVTRGGSPHLSCKPDQINPFAPEDFAEKRVLKLVEWFSGHCHTIKS